ncbi:MAG: PD-(D/E)XK nuclease family protein [Dysgonamonadaceae bacterium]|jgi:CRISPR/Cas system-associated exonuclease Cas4 (RecB family)|nr:PD-(D/E)XK nuclease family protein [Dysgonamonadaceae bacterium]
MNFLQAVAKNLYTTYGDEISSLTLVFPSRRAQLFFSDELATLINKPVWSPDYASLEEIVSSLSTLQKIDDFSLLTLLYQVYKKHTHSEETFDKFYFWGETLLNDFDDIDKYLVDAKLLFRNLKSQKTFEGDFSFLTDEQIAYIQQFWESFNPAGDAGLQSKFTEIWDVLLSVYTEFKSVLREKNQAYSGMIYRDVVEKMQRDELPEIQGKYAFIGFNALGKCELDLFSYLKKSDKAIFFWDYDDYYINDKKQEAGMFLRKNIKQFPAPSSFNLQSEFTSGKDVHIIASPSDVLQAKAISKILTEMNAGFDRKTAIVLTDENILIPVLHSLPDECSDVNITLGYPLLQTPVFSLAELLIRLQNSYRENNSGFYYKDVLAILRHSYVIDACRENTKEIIDNIVNNNMIYIDCHLFENNPFLKKIFVPFSSYGELTNYLIDIFTSIASVPSSGDEQIALRKEYIYYMTKSLNRLKKSIEEINLEIGKSVFLSLIRDIFRNLKIPFMGEPVKGLQIMNIQETRALDFENLILLSVNEGRLPHETNKASYIPYNLRKGYGLPCREDSEAISAYNFYRLIQRAKHLRLLYSSKTDENRTGEMSRYLYQLKFETKLNIKEYPVTFNISFGETPKITVEKDETVQQILMKYTGDNPQKTLSPSALSKYIACPLKFYFSSILKLESDESVVEELQLNQLGNIIHNVMEKLYSNLINKKVSEKDIEDICTNTEMIESLIDTHFAQVFYKKDSLPANFNENGKLLVTRDVIRKYVKKILEYDKNNSGFTFLGLEEKIKIKFSIGNLTVGLEGTIDRIDKQNNTLRIIDYKTGAGRGADKRMKFNSVESLFDSNPEVLNKEAFQTFMYALMYRKSKNPPEKIVPALYFVKDSYSLDFNYHLIDEDIKEGDGKKGKEVTDFSVYQSLFEECLTRNLRELFDFGVPFTQTEHKRTCKSCSCRIICKFDD